MSKKKSKSQNRSNNNLSAFLRKPLVQVGILALVALVIYLIAAGGGTSTATNTAGTLPAEVSVEQAYEMYQQEDVFVVDVREQFEWDEYHAPNTTLIPLAELQSRLSEVPKDKKILVVCRSGNRSQEGRDILLNAGFDATSMDGGLKTWYALGYPTEGQPAQ